MAEKLKVLICGDVESNFDAIFDKVRNLNKKSPFAFLLCVGNFFSDTGNYEGIEKYKTGAKTVPIPTYILGPNSKEQEEIYNKLGIDENNNEICPNLSYLGRKGVYTLSSKFTIAYLSGKELQEGETKEPWHFDKKDVVAVRNSAYKNFSNMDDYRGIDFLLTSQWSAGIKEDDESGTSKLISFLSLHAKPRYHFCALNDVHYEKPPFRLPAANVRSIEPVSRFIALAKVNNPTKTKFLYAMNIQPLSEMRLTELMMKSTDEIECPYISMDFSKVGSDEKESSNAQFFWGSPGDHQDRKRGRNDQHQNKRFKPMVDQEKCWFCLQSQDIEKHLIISIGEHFYLALAKNPVSNFHVLIIPVSHIQASSHLTDDLFKELFIFKKSLKQFYENNNMAAVFFERNYMTSHCIINAVGIPSNLEFEIKETLKDKAEEFSLSFETIPKLSSPKDLPEKGAYFVVEYGAEQETEITRSMKHFPINFGRDLVCAPTLLNAEDKVDWKNCKLPKHIEEDLVGKFKAAYKDYDFNADDGDDSD